MTKAAIFSLLPVKPNSTIASVRIARWLSVHLGVELLDGPQIADKELDVLFIVNGSTLFCKCLPELAKAVSTAREVVWVQNDYTLPPPKPESDAQSPFRLAFARRKLVPHYWTTCAENVSKTSKSGVVNWNCLGFSEQSCSAPLEADSWFYYGAFRERRIESFKYVDTIVNWKVSSTSKKFDDFPHARRMEPISRDRFYEELRQHGMGLYMQDDRSADKIHQPATRFYEMLSVGLPMTFTPDCVRTLAKYGYDVSPYVLTRESAKTLMENRTEVAKKQTAWVQDFESQLRQRVDTLWGVLCG